MTETNRQSALSAAAFSMEFGTPVEQVFQRAEQFFEWLENDGTTAATDEPSTGRCAVDEITDLVRRKRTEWGGLFTDEVLGRVHELDGLPFDEAIEAAIRATPGLQHAGEIIRSQFIDALENLLNGTDEPQPAAEATTPTVPRGNTASRIVDILRGAVRQYGAPAQRLLDEAVAAGPTLTTAQAIRRLQHGQEIRDYPAQVAVLIGQINAL